MSLPYVSALLVVWVALAAPLAHGGKGKEADLLPGPPGGPEGLPYVVDTLERRCFGGLCTISVWQYASGQHFCSVRSDGVLPDLGTPISRSYREQMADEMSIEDCLEIVLEDARYWVQVSAPIVPPIPPPTPSAAPISPDYRTHQLY